MHAFPILITDEKYTVTGKNSAAKYYFKDIRIGSSLSKKASFSEDGTLTLQNTDSPFKNGVLFNVETGDRTSVLVLFLLGIQCKLPTEADFPKNIEEILKVADAKCAKKPDRLYGEFAGFVHKYRRGSNGLRGVSCNMMLIKKCVEEYVAKRFRSLGYRASISLSSDVWTKNYYFMNFDVLLCTLALITYVAMRASKSGAVDIEIDFDGRDGMLTVSAFSKAREELSPSSDGSVRINDIAPECLTETALLNGLSGSRYPMKFKVCDGIFGARAYLDAVPSEDLILGAGGHNVREEVRFVFDGVGRELKKKIKNQR